MAPMDWSVYILECADGSFYTGITSNLEQRVDTPSQSAPYQVAIDDTIEARGFYARASWDKSIGQSEQADIGIIAGAVPSLTMVSACSTPQTSRSGQITTLADSKSLE